MTTDRSFGIIPVHLTDDQRHYLLVQHGKGHWGFPKGHQEPGESPADTAKRELTEETGLDGVHVLEDATFTERYLFTNKAGQPVRKTVTYFIGLVTHHTDPTAQPGEIADCAWLTPAEVRQRMTFDEGRRLLDQAEHWLNEHPQS